MSEGREQKVRAAFAEQAMWCERLGSPFTASLCRLLGERLGRGTPIGDKVLAWAGDPAPIADSVPLRLCGGLHFLARNGEADSLTRCYPPESPEDDALWSGIATVLETQGDFLVFWIDNTPQTNEVGRSSLLMAGLLAATARYALPIRLYELGASAGLNLVLDRYHYRLGGREAGEPDSPLCLEPDWQGPAPPDATVRIIGRAGVDLAPLDVRNDRERLIAYVWPDQEKRLRQIETAFTIAATDPPEIERGDAADWIEQRLSTEPERGVLRVAMHSVAFHYFPQRTQDRIAAHLEQVGATASEAAPLGWLRFEKAPEEPRFSLRLRLWPGADRLLAWADPHGKEVEWLIESGRDRR